MIALLGVPYDGGSSFQKGAAKAPQAIRRALRSQSSNMFSESEIDLGNHPEVKDLGDLEWRQPDTIRDEIEQTISEIVGRGDKVISLGGDHSITYPVLRGYATKYGTLNVVQLDAHPDLYSEFEGQRYSHASPFARALEDGIVSQLTQIGIRTINLHQREQIDKYSVRVITAKDFSDSVIELDGPVYLSVDLDVLDPAFAPGISHYEPGGLSVRQVLQVIQEIGVPIIGADIVEFNPTKDIHDQTAMVAAKLLKEMLARMLAQP